MAVHIVAGVTIHTRFHFWPIPHRAHDWLAVLDGYEGGDPIGYGATETEAIADLMTYLPDDEPAAHEPFPGHSHYGG